MHRFMKTFKSFSFITLEFHMNATRLITWLYLFYEAINRFIMKLIKTNNNNIIDECHAIVGVTLPTLLQTRNNSEFIWKFKCTENCICNSFN